MVMTLTKVILLVVGSFNPPTIMHLRMFEIARDHLEALGRFEVICGIMSPVHDMYGKKGLISAKHRKEMLKLALQNTDWISISDWESSQDHWVPTRQVLQYHQNQINAILNETWNMGKRKHDEENWIKQVLLHCDHNDKPVVKLLCGGDMIETFAIPGLWLEDDIETILKDHGLVVVTRSGSNTPKSIYESDILSKYQKNVIIVMEWITNEISSSKVRRAIQRYQSVKYLVADSVIDYIVKNHLYDKLSVDMPDNLKNFVIDRNDINFKSSVVTLDGAIQVLSDINEDHGKNNCFKINHPMENEDVPKVEIQITKDGTIQVISDKETTV
uniref:Nicotinamide-nucleotide adenylyltransferase n=2 Tax=Clastoptera arizonana TaxID=38151 RepID=A0A1B6CEI4_9HEMI